MNKIADRSCKERAGATIDYEDAKLRNPYSGKQNGGNLSELSERTSISGRKANQKTKAGPGDRRELAKRPKGVDRVAGALRSNVNVRKVKQAEEREQCDRTLVRGRREGSDAGTRR